MAIPTPAERPDLYDDYDGLPDGQKSSVTASPRLQELMSARESDVAGRGPPSNGETPCPDPD